VTSHVRVKWGSRSRGQGCGFDIVVAREVVRQILDAMLSCVGILVWRLRLQSCLDFGMRRWMACEVRQAWLMKGVKRRERHHI
jgi:hypothetical protein